MHLGRSQLRTRIGSQPAAPVCEGGECPRRRCSPGDRGPCLAGSVLAAQPSSEDADVDVRQILAVIVDGVAKERGQVAEYWVNSDTLLLLTQLQVSA